MLNKKIVSQIIVVLLMVPILGVTIAESTEKSKIWIVSPDFQDRSVNVALQTFSEEMIFLDSDIRLGKLSEIDAISNIDILIIIGHGQPDGLKTQEGIMPWSTLYHSFEHLELMKTVVLACHSPTDLDSRIFGFSGQIDAEAGSLLAAWIVKSTLFPQERTSIDGERVITAQMELRYPLDNFVYFVHGYFGSNPDMYEMRTWLSDQGYLDSYSEPELFSYFDAYNAISEAEKDQVHWNYDITDFATDFANQILSDIPFGSHVSIVTHSMGGLITREMLRLYRNSLETQEIIFDRVITLGTPHSGTWFANPLNIWNDIISLINYLDSEELWPSPVFWSMIPGSSFILSLNNDLSYMDNIHLLTLTAGDPIKGIGASLLTGVGYPNDDIVDVASGRGTNPTYSIFFNDMNHEQLIYDPDNGHRTFPYVGAMLNPTDDADEDGLLDSDELSIHGTDPFNHDTDCDGLSDGEEILNHFTDPLLLD